MIKITSTENGIQFSLSDDIIAKITEWRRLMDEEMYQYQIETGFVVKGENTRLSDVHMTAQKLIRRAEKLNIKQPYKGVSGGDVSYQFSMIEEGPMLKVHNCMNNRSLMVKNSPASVADEQKLIKYFEIEPSEMQQLTLWMQTDKGHGGENDYVYYFAGTSLGLVTKVINLKNKEFIDLTDYGEW